MEKGKHKKEEIVSIEQIIMQKQKINKVDINNMFRMKKKTQQKVICNFKTQLYNKKMPVTFT